MMPSFPRPMRCPSKGFTLVEVMLVVLIVAIIAAVATARLGKTDPQRLVSAAQLLAADLAYAQIESITKGEDPRRVVLLAPAGATAAHGYQIEARSNPGTPIINPVGKQPYNVTFGQGRAAALAGVRITGQSVGGDGQVEFGLYGQLDQTTDATITLTCGTGRITLTINAVSGETTLGDVQ